MNWKTKRVLNWHSYCNFLNWNNFCLAAYHLYSKILYPCINFLHALTEYSFIIHYSTNCHTNIRIVYMMAWPAIHFRKDLHPTSPNGLLLLQYSSESNRTKPEKQKSQFALWNCESVFFFFLIKYRVFFSQPKHTKISSLVQSVKDQQ